MDLKYLKSEVKWQLRQFILEFVWYFLGGGRRGCNRLGHHRVKRGGHGRYDRGDIWCKRSGRGAREILALAPAGWSASRATRRLAGRGARLSPVRWYGYLGNAVGRRRVSCYRRDMAGDGCYVAGGWCWRASARGGDSFGYAWRLGGRWRGFLFDLGDEGGMILVGKLPIIFITLLPMP